MMTTNVWLNQEWSDYKLKWDPSEYGGIEDINLPAEQIWLPDIVLYNSAEGYFAVSIMTKAKVRYDGYVTWNPPAIFRSSCQIDITYFPFDSQNCHLKFGSWTFGAQIDLRHINDTEQSIERGTDLSEYYQNVEWDIMQASARRNVKTYTCCPNDFYPDVTFNFTLRRKPLFYTVNLILPCVGITILSFLVFYLPSDSGEKVTLTISILVSLIFFLSVLIETIPSTSLAMPLLGKYLVFTMILITVSVCATVCVLNIHFRTPSTHSMSPWVKRWCIEILPKWLLMTVPQHQSQQANILPEQLIYPHNQVYWSMVNNSIHNNNNNNNNAPNKPTTTEANEAKHQQQHQQCNNVQPQHSNIPNLLNPISLETEIQKLSLSPSSLFLPYLQSEAARRLQLQRSRSSDRDQRSECLAATTNAQTTNTTTTNCDSHDSGRQQQQFTSIDMPAQSQSSSSTNNNNNTDTIRLNESVRRRTGSSGAGEPNKQASETKRAKRGKSHFWSSWFGGADKARAPQVEVHGVEQGGHNQGGQCRPPLLKHDTSSSLETDYQHHNHFQARASVCSTNLWRIGPTRRCSLAAPVNYPTYYRPQLLHPNQIISPDGRPELSTVSGCVQGHYHRRMPGDDSSDSSSACGGFEGAVGALITATATNLPVRPKSVGPSSQLQRANQNFVEADHHHLHHHQQQQHQQQQQQQQQQQRSAESYNLVMRNAGFGGGHLQTGNAGSRPQHLPPPPPPLNTPQQQPQMNMNRQQQKQSLQMRRQQPLTSSQQQQHSSGLLLAPANLVVGDRGGAEFAINPPGSLIQSTGLTYDGHRVSLGGPRTTEQLVAACSSTGSMQHYGTAAAAACPANINLPHGLLTAGGQPSQYHPTALGNQMSITRSRSTDQRLCMYGSSIYLPAGQETTIHRQLKPSASAQPQVYQQQRQAAQLYQTQQQTQSSLGHLFVQREQNESIVPTNSSYNLQQQQQQQQQQQPQPQSIGRALGQVYMQRLQRQPTIYSLNSSTIQRPSRSSQRGTAYPLLSMESQQRPQHHQHGHSQTSVDKMRRSKSQNSLDKRPGLTALDCAECNTLRRTESRVKAMNSYELQNVKQPSSCLCDSRQRLNSGGFSQLSNGGFNGSLSHRKDHTHSANYRRDCCSTGDQLRCRDPNCGVPARPAPDCQVSRYQQQKRPITALGLLKLISEVEKAIQNAMFIAQHIDNLDEFESVKENWKYIAMVIDRIFLIVFLIACIGGTVIIFAMAPWSYYTTEKPIDLQLTRLMALNLTGVDPYTRSCRDF